MNMKKIRKYSDLLTMSTFEERFKYLKLNGSIGVDTFGFDRYMNQNFYKSKEWKDIRDYVIVRDGACDLGIPGKEITGKIYIHHMNPINQEDIKNSSDNLLNPEYLICVSHETHNAIHYGDESILNKQKIVERYKNDTCLWNRR